MATKILGVQHFDFKDDDGRQVVGDKLHCVEFNKNVVGQGVFTQSVKPEVLLRALDEAGLSDAEELIGMCVDFGYDRRGKVTSFQVYDEA